MKVIDALNQLLRAYDRAVGFKLLSPDYPTSLSVDQIGGLLEESRDGAESELAKFLGDDLLQSWQQLLNTDLEPLSRTESTNQAA